VCPAFAGQSLESRLAAQRRVRRASVFVSGTAMLEANQPEALAPGGDGVARSIRQGAFGFLVAMVFAGLAASALFGLVFVPFVPRGGRIVAALLALGIGVSQAVYALPLYLWARRRGALQFSSGFRSGAAMVALLNALLIAVAVLFPGFED